MINRRLVCPYLLSFACLYRLLAAGGGSSSSLQTVPSATPSKHPAAPAADTRLPSPTSPCALRTLALSVTAAAPHWFLPRASPCQSVFNLGMVGADGTASVKRATPIANTETTKKTSFASCKQHHTAPVHAHKCSEKAGEYPGDGRGVVLSSPASTQRASEQP